MFKNELKTIFRNKNNLVYLIIFFIIFIILNFSFNLKLFINKYYDKKINKYIDKCYEIAQKENITTETKYEELVRTIYTSDGKKLTNEQIQNLKHLKYVQDIKTNNIDIPTFQEPITVYCIIVDDWKNCQEIQQFLDIQGISSYIANIDKSILEEYQTTKNFTNIIKYTLFLISLIIFILCYKNIIYNERENIKLLKIFGYRKKQIRKIVLIQLLTLTLIGAITGYIIFRILFILINCLLKF